MSENKNRYLSECARIIRKHYGLSRAVTHDEVIAELKSIERKRADGSLDNSQEQLAARLSLVQI